MRTIEKTLILELLACKKEFTAELIVQYLDYSDKVCYSVEEVISILTELERIGTVRSKDENWYLT